MSFIFFYRNYHTLYKSFYASIFLLTFSGSSFRLILALCFEKCKGTSGLWAMTIRQGEVLIFTEECFRKKPLSSNLLTDTPSKHSHFILVN